MYEKWLYLQLRHLAKPLETTYVLDLPHRSHMIDPIVSGHTTTNLAHAHTHTRTFEYAHFN